MLFGLWLCCLTRIWFALGRGLPFESDEAIVGLMARHILYRGELPLFYYGQSYLGPLEPASAALVFAIGGPTLGSLRMAPLFFSLIFVAFTTLFARRAFGAAAGWAGLAYFVVPPLFLLTWSVKARGGYSELIALGAMSLWLTLAVASEKEKPTWQWLLLGAVWGLALWTDPLSMVYLAPTGLYVALHRRWRIIHWKTLGTMCAFLIAAGPLLVANLRSHGETLRELSGPNVTQPTTLPVFRENVVSTVHQSFPILLGFFEASSNLPAFAAARASAGWPEPFLILLEGSLALVGGVLFAISGWHAVRLRPTPVDLLVWVGAATIALFCVSQIEFLYLSEPRYLLPLYSLVPIGGLYWSRAWSSHRGVAIGFLACLIALNVTSVLRFDPSLSAPRLANQVVDAGNPSLARFLEARGISTIYSDYWLAYPVAFESQERIIPSVIDGDLHVGFNRYIPYAIAVDRSPDPAVLVVAGSPAETNLRALLQSSGSSYRLGRWRNLDVFDHIVPTFRPAPG